MDLPNYADPNNVILHLTETRFLNNERLLSSALSAKQTHPLSAVRRVCPSYRGATRRWRTLPRKRALLASTSTARASSDSGEPTHLGPPWHRPPTVHGGSQHPRDTVLHPLPQCLNPVGWWVFIPGSPLSLPPFLQRGRLAPPRGRCGNERWE
jgi:hypothetical protein